MPSKFHYLLPKRRLNGHRNIGLLIYMGKHSSKLSEMGIYLRR